MATVVGEAGRSALIGAIRRAITLPAMVLALGVGVFPFLWLAFALTEAKDVFWVTVAATSIVYAIASRRDWADAFELAIEARDWAKGADGEKITADQLAKLPCEYLVLNDVHPRQHGNPAAWNWDHVVIGPKGLFVVDAKNYSATRIRDGESDPRTKRNVKQVRGYAVAFKSALVKMNPDLRDVYVSAVLAYVNEGAWVEKLRERDVRVLPMRLLTKDILTGPGTCLTTHEATKIANYLFAEYPPHLQEAYRTDFQRWCKLARASGWSAGTDRTTRVSAVSAGAGVRSVEPAPAFAAANPAQLTCPRCGSDMRRIAGRNGLGDFFGCKAYRARGCTGKRNLAGEPI